MDKNRQIYRQLCSSSYIPLHAKDWWFDTICGKDNWSVALSFDNLEKVNGALPYFKIQQLGLYIIKPIPFLTYNNVFLSFPHTNEIKKERKYTLEKRILEKLILQLPRVSFYQQNFNPSFFNTLPFYWNGFKQTTRYTYILEDLKNLDNIFSGFKRTVRTDIRKAESQVQVIASENIEILYNLMDLSFKRNNQSNHYEFSLLKRLHAVLVQKKCCKILLAKDTNSGEFHAGILVAWDEKRAYTMMSGIHPDLKTSAALNLLFWEAIKEASKHVSSLDFEGSMIPNIEHVIRAFGGTRTPYHNIYKAKNKFFYTLALWIGKI